MDKFELSTRVNRSFTITNFLSTENTNDLIHEIYTGLTARQKYISSRFFYDENGSSLFEEISTLLEYYPTRTEKSILKANVQKIVEDFENSDIIELGSGDCSKISILLDAIPKSKLVNVNYIPVDVSEAAIFNSADILALKYPGLTIHGLLADFMKHLTQLPGRRNKLICFFGSTLGNLSRSKANEFLLNLKDLMVPGDKFLLGLDMVKDIQLLHEAYNDKRGITALFNRNILNVMNDIAGTDFIPLHFEHHAWYNKEKTRIEMHLKALKDTVVSSEFFPEKIILKRGETIHTENSHKYTLQDIQILSTISGLHIKNIFTDDRRWFSLVIFNRDD